MDRRELKSILVANGQNPALRNGLGVGKLHFPKSAQYKKIGPNLTIQFAGKLVSLPLKVPLKKAKTTLASIL